MNILTFEIGARKNRLHLNTEIRFILLTSTVKIKLIINRSKANHHFAQTIKVVDDNCFKHIFPGFLSKLSRKLNIFNQKNDKLKIRFFYENETHRSRRRDVSRRYEKFTWNLHHIFYFFHYLNKMQQMYLNKLRQEKCDFCCNNWRYSKIKSLYVVLFRCWSIHGIGWGKCNSNVWHLFVNLVMNSI